jgi:hypothetical protein
MLVPLAPTVVPELQHMSTVNDLKDGVMGDSGDIVERNDRSLPAVPHSWRERESHEIPQSQSSPPGQANAFLRVANPFIH